MCFTSFRAHSRADRTILKIAGSLTTGPVVVTIIFNIMNLPLIAIKYSPILRRAKIWIFVCRYPYICTSALPNIYLHNIQIIFLSTPYSNILSIREKHFLPSTFPPVLYFTFDLFLKKTNLRAQSPFLFCKDENRLVCGYFFSFFTVHL